MCTPVAAQGRTRRLHRGARGYAVGMADQLRRYRGKRNFARTSEPRGRAHTSGDAARFVVQKHDASTLHYDFRIEVDGVLKSWAVPKGPSVDPRDRRLAVPTEDHPLEYADFEGVIAEGEYGAGTVLVWDTGDCEHLTDRDVAPADALERGRINIWLEGDKIRGGYTLTRMGKGSDNWLLIKMRDAGSDRRRKPTTRQPRSVLSGRDLGEVAEHGQRLD